MKYLLLLIILCSTVFAEVPSKRMLESPIIAEIF